MYMSEIIKKYVEIKEHITSLNATLRNTRQLLHEYEQELIDVYNVPDNALTEIKCEGVCIKISTKKRKKPVARKHFKDIILKRLGDTEAAKSLIEDIKNGGEEVEKTSVDVKSSKN